MISKNKKTKSTTRHKPIARRPLLVVGIILAIAVVGLVVMKLIEGSAATPDTAHDTTADPATHTESDIAPVTDQTTTSPQTPTQYEGESANNSPSLTGVITYAEADQTNLTVLVNIDQYLTTGTCELTLSASGTATIHRTATIIPSASTSTCDGFTVPLAELTSGSTYSITVKVASDDKTGIIDQKEVTIP